MGRPGAEHFERSSANPDSDSSAASDRELVPLATGPLINAWGETRVVSIAKRNHLVAMARIGVAFGWIAVAGTAVAQEYAPPPSTRIVCPAIEEDGMLCAADFMSGNCDDFVSTADRLGALYRAELQKLPGSEASLKSTRWWGCGPGNLQNIKTLLAQIGSPHAATVLQTEPYRSLPPVQIPAPPPPPTPSSPQPQCDDLKTTIERNLCIGAKLQAARARHKSTFDRCKELVVADLRGDLLSAESSFEALLPGRCDAEAEAADDESLQTFERSRCLIAAQGDNTRGMLDAHPECAAA